MVSTWYFYVFFQLGQSMLGLKNPKNVQNIRRTRYLSTQQRLMKRTRTWNHQTRCSVMSSWRLSRKILLLALILNEERFVARVSFILMKKHILLFLIISNHEHFFQAYLSDEEFESVLGMTKEAFYKVPKWKQDVHKKKVDLF